MAPRAITVDIASTYLPAPTAALLLLLLLDDTFSDGHGKLAVAGP